MTQAAAEKWITERLARSGGEMPAADIVAEAVAAGVGSPATVHRAGSNVAEKTRRGSRWFWAAQQAEPAAEPARTPEEHSGVEEMGGYWLWTDQRLRLEADRRGIDLDGYDHTHSELCMVLINHDDGWRPDPPRGHRIPLPF